MNRKAVFTVTGLMAALVAAATPSVTLNGVSQGAGRKVVVDYTLTDGPAVVTVDFQIDGQPVTYIRDVWGDVNRLVTDDGAHTLTWSPDRDCPGLDVAAGGFKAVVKAWSPATPPDYMVVDLEFANTVFYYASTNALPDGGLANDVYRTSRMVFRRIPAKNVQWVMGSPWTDPSRDQAKEGTHYVTLTEDYYMGIFEVTQAQYKRIFGSNPSLFASLPDAAIRACDNVSYRQSRGGVNDSVNWPATGHAVWTGSYLYKLRAHVGQQMLFDLPTEAQWEYACRAGEGKAFNVGVNALDDSFAWWADNSAVDGVIQPHPVGRKRPNAWGLYDMHGNVTEWCLDWAYINGVGWNAYAAEAVTDPEGPSYTTTSAWDGSYRRVRGGSFGDVQNTLRSGARAGFNHSANYLNDMSNANSRRVGIRVCCPIGSGVTL